MFGEALELFGIFEEVVTDDFRNGVHALYGLPHFSFYGREIWTSYWRRHLQDDRRRVPRWRSGQDDSVMYWWWKMFEQIVELRVCFMGQNRLYEYSPSSVIEGVGKRLQVGGFRKRHFLRYGMCRLPHRERG